ncbi:MAG TPA: alpha/beta fold hydrolase [Gemmatimonadaceae bacterium]|nr:alpha/beta fold hydrolase [Gemmatimonadaceae bacterium]
MQSRTVMTVASALLLCHCVAREAPAQENDMRLETPTGTLHGTLLLPAGTKVPVPVALIIAGSGPTDRDGNSPLLPGRNNSLRLVAEALAASGVASLRTDKRGVGASAGAMTTESSLLFTTYVEDAAAWAAQLAADPRFSRVIIVGHSEGSLLGIMAAQRGKVAGVVSLAGAGRPIAEVLDEQLSRNLGPGALLEESRRIIAALSSGKPVGAVPQELQVLFRPSVQPYLRSWLPIDPAVEIAKLDVPVLVVQGTTDIQSAATDAERLAKHARRGTLAMVDGMNHVLKEVRDPAKQMASYGDPSLALHPDLVRALDAFVRQP